MVRMTLHHRRRFLQAACIALAAGTVLAICLAAFVPLEATSEFALTGTTTTSSSTQTDSGSVQKPLSAYAVVYKTNLAQPLFDASPPAPVEKPPPKLNLRLTGTAVEPGFTCAFFQASDGTTKVVAQGSTIDGAEVVAIAPGSATVKYAGTTFTLKVDKDKDKDRAP